MNNRAKPRAGGGSAGKWASVQSRLAEMFQSSAPHVRQNLATLAAALADDPEALETLASIAAEVADDVAQKRGQSEQDVLRAVLEERERLDPPRRDEFDEQLREKLGSRWRQWDIGTAVAGLMQLDLPLATIPVDAFANAILDEAAEYPFDDKGQRDAPVRAKVRDRLQRFRAAEESADTEYRQELRQALSTRLAAMSPQERAPVLLVFQRLWPALVDPRAEYPPLARDWDLYGALTQGRGSIWHRLGRAALAGAAAAIALVLLITATLLIQGFPLGSASSESIPQAIGTTLFLLAIGFLAGGAVAGLYVPTGGRRLSWFMLARHWALPAAAGAVMVAGLTYFRPQTVGLQETDSTIVMPFLSAFAALLVMLATLYFLARQPRQMLQRNRQGWNVALIAGPSILLVVFGSLIAHWFDNPGAGMFAPLFGAVVAAAAAGWSIETPNLGTDRTADRPGTTGFHKFAGGAAVLAGLLMLSTLALAYGVRNHARSVAVAVRQPDGQPGLVARVPKWIPFILDVEGQRPVRLDPYFEILGGGQASDGVMVRISSQEWTIVAEKRQGNETEVEAASGQTDSELQFHHDRTRRIPALEGFNSVRDPVCVACEGFPSFGQWLRLILRPEVDRADEDARLSLVPATSAGRERRAEWADGMLTLEAGTPVLVRIPRGSAYRFAMDAAEVYLTFSRRASSGADENSFVRRVKPQNTTTTDMSAADRPSALAGWPIVFPSRRPLGPGLYRICIVFHQRDVDACSTDRRRRQNWVHYPGTAPLLFADELAPASPDDVVMNTTF